MDCHRDINTQAAVTKGLQMIWDSPNLRCFTAMSQLVWDFFSSPRGLRAPWLCYVRLPLLTPLPSLGASTPHLHEGPSKPYPYFKVLTPMPAPKWGLPQPPHQNNSPSRCHFDSIYHSLHHVTGGRADPQPHYLQLTPVMDHGMLPRWGQM